MMNSSIFIYSDYRKFLRDYYEFQKRSQKGFSFRSFAAKAGIRSAGFLNLVVEGKKNLSLENAVKLADAMELNETESRYFQNLVQFAQAKTLEDKKNFLEALNQNFTASRPQEMGDEAENYLKHWYLPVLREMPHMPDFKENPQWIASRMLFPVSAKEIKKGMQFLEAAGFWERDSEGGLKKTRLSLGKGNINPGTSLEAAARNYHGQMIDLARQALFHLPREKRNTANTTLSFSKKSYAKAIERIEAMRYELLQLSEADQEVDKLFQLNVNLFPLIKEEQR